MLVSELMASERVRLPTRPKQSLGSKALPIRYRRVDEYGRPHRAVEGWQP